jgi:putative FmdB family regulatory protein
MPVYTYRCENCGVQFERQQSYKDEPLTRCPECKKKSLKKVIAPVGVVFKGSGFYSTDNKSSSSARDTSSSKQQEKSEAKESKAETKAETKSSESKD